MGWVAWKMWLKVVRAPKLEMLGYLHLLMQRLDLGKSVFKMSQYTADVSLSTLLFTLKTLAVEVKIHYCEEVKMFIHHLLKCFPCLEAKRCCTFGVCVLERTKSNCLQVLEAAKSSRLP